MPFQKYVTGTLPRTDLIIQNSVTGECLSCFEIKLTALPDNTTCSLSENLYGSEIVIRPDTIVYLACSLASKLNKSVLAELKQSVHIDDWTEPFSVIGILDKIMQSLNNIVLQLEKTQTPFLLQPVWKTIGKSPKLAEHCLDVFMWSDIAFTKFITELACADTNMPRITRQTRTAIWLFKMLFDLESTVGFNPSYIVDSLSFNTKNDKAFASSGNITNRYMNCDNLTKPRIMKNEIKNIILGGGQELLSSERRFDAIIFNSPELFEQ